MKYTDLVKKCNEVANYFCLDSLKTDESQAADAKRSEAAARIREWLQAEGVKPFDKSKRKYHFEDCDNYLHTAFYETNIYIRKQNKTRTLHNIVRAKSEKQKEQQQKQLDEAWAETLKIREENIKKREREELMKKIASAKTTKAELIELLKQQIAM